MVAPRSLCIVSPFDGKVEVVEESLAERNYAWCRQVYGVVGAGDQFKLAPQVPEDGTIVAAKWFLDKWENI